MISQTYYELQLGTEFFMGFQSKLNLLSMQMIMT